MSEEKTVIRSNLKELHGSGFEIADGEPDIRGWKVKTAQNQSIGKVKELLFDPSSFRVRYVAIHLNGRPLNLLSRDILIPIGLAELHEKDNVVLFPEVAVGHFASLPDYKKGEVTIVTERAIRTVFAPSEGVAYKDVDFNDPEFYNNEYFNEERMYRLRRRPDANVEGYQKRIVPSTRVNESTTDTASLKQPVQEGSFAPFREGVIEIKEHSEVPVVSKEARVVEEVSINKDVEERNEKVKDSVRKTEIDVEKLREKDLTE